MKMPQIATLLVLLLMLNCTSTKWPFNQSLKNVIDKFIQMYPNGDVIQVQSSKIGTHELLIITNRKSYDPDMIDGYCIYKTKLITYYQTDSTNRDSIVRIDRLLKYEGKINGYKNAYATNVSFEPKQEIYKIFNKDSIVQIKDISKLKFSDMPQSENVIANKELNEIINSYIYQLASVLYELKFIRKGNRSFVTLRSMPFYDKKEYDGYFYRDGHLIVLYGVNQSRNILERKWIKGTEGGIPHFRHVTIKRWNYPYPLKMEILSNGKVRILSLEEGFFI